MENVNIFAKVHRHRINAAGEVPIVIAITLNNKPILEDPLHRRVKLSEWNQELRKTNDIALNRLIEKRRSELLEEITRLELNDIKPTKIRIKKIAKGEDLGKDFIKYCLQRIPERYPELKQKETRRTYIGEVTKLQEFQKDITFSDIDAHFLSRYRAWLINERENSANTIWKSFKFMNTMFNDAISAKLIKYNPFSDFDRGRYTQGRKNYLEISECDAINKVMQTDIPERLKLVGAYYLFMCYTGFRFQDATKFFNYTEHVINDERIIINTQKFGTDVNILIHNRLRQVLEFVKKHPLNLSNKEFNSYTKVLATMAGISQSITAHTGRHTFGAALAEMDVPIEKAQKLMGHKDKRSTEVYYHIKNKSLDAEMRKWDQMY